MWQVWARFEIIYFITSNHTQIKKPLGFSTSHPVPMRWWWKTHWRNRHIRKMFSIIWNATSELIRTQVWITNNTLRSRRTLKKQKKNVLNLFYLGNTCVINCSYKYAYPNSLMRRPDITYKYIVTLFCFKLWPELLLFLTFSDENNWLFALSLLHFTNYYGNVLSVYFFFWIVVKSFLLTLFRVPYD